MVTHLICQYCEAKKSTENRETPPTDHKNFRYPKHSETQRGSPTNFVGSIREKNSTEKSDINLRGYHEFFWYFETEISEIFR